MPRIRTTLAKDSGTYQALGDVQIAVAEPLRAPKRGLTRSEAVKAFEDGKAALINGTLQTKKAAWAAKAQFAAATGTAQTIPEYRDLTAGLGDNTTITADKGFFTAVTAVYDLTTDSGRTTNLLSAFTRDNQGLTLTTSVTATDNLEVQGTLLPYQGVFLAQNPAAFFADGLDSRRTWFEVVHWNGNVMLTTNGTGGTAATPSALQAHSPLIPKLPLGGGAYKNSTFVSDGLGYFVGVGGSDPVKWLRENIPIESYRQDSGLSGGGDRFRVGQRIALGGANSERGIQSLSPNMLLNLGQFAASPYPNYLAVIMALVRVCDGQRDAAQMPFGRLLMFVWTYTNAAAAYPAIASGFTTSAADVYQLPGSPDFFEGMRVIV